MLGASVKPGLAMRTLSPAADGTTVVARVDAHAQAKEQQVADMYLDLDKVHVFETGDAGVNLGCPGAGALGKA